MLNGGFSRTWLQLSLPLLAALRLYGADLNKAWSQLRSGEYEGSIDAAQRAISTGERGDDWHLILVEGLLTTGRIPEARAALTNALARESRSVRLRWLGRSVLLANGDVEGARDQLREIAQLVSTRPANYREAASLVVFGQAALASGADPKTVLDRVFEVARKLEPTQRDIYLASGELALEKHDFALAAQRFDEGLKQSTNDADLYYGRARAFAGSDREVTAASIAAALKANPNHVPSLLLLADHRIDAEDYSGAREVLKRVNAVNPVHPEAAAYRAVLAHLQNQPKEEQAAQAEALRYWPKNPRVPHLIGLKLSQKYRFAEGATRQREALAWDPDYLPAKAQLANDLLRLGDETAGWQLAQEVHTEDAYDVTMFNLVTLHDTMAGYRSLTNDHFVVRMLSHEADVFGPRVLSLLERARATLVPKYGVILAEPTTVEIFADGKDFGVRTFGMPDNPGYLGVCFGRVVTANSPSANGGGTVNWEAVLWHEYCHVVTLQLTQNKMPRWLSEGISVFEERQANPAWGEQLIPKYREMILGDDLTPVSRLSAAFLMPKSPLHLQFAYYESSLVVEFLIDRFGLDGLRAVLGDLRAGQFINDALEQHTRPLDTLEKEFAAFARKRAESLAPSLDWEKPELGQTRGRASADFAEAMTKWSATRPTNFWALDFQAQSRIDARDWPGAKVALEKLVNLFPNQPGPGNASIRLARVHRELGDTNAERQLLASVAEREAAVPEVYLRLLELAASTHDWPEVTRNAERYLAVNPLAGPPYRYLAEASEQTDQPAAAIAAYETWLRLDPPNPGAVHFQLAQLLQASDAVGAKRHTLQALEEAPRNRAALDLLVKLAAATDSPSKISRP